MTGNTAKIRFQWKDNIETVLVQQLC